MFLFVPQQNLNCRIQSRNPEQDPEYEREFAENFELCAALF
jgi:hypothetical protein